MKTQLTNINQLHQFIEQFNFATIVNHDNDGLNVSHVPVILDSDEGPQGTLKWHLAKQNVQAQKIADNKEILCIFQGPHAYISPRWYKNQPSVPTWNYAVVHVYGNPEQVSDQELENDLSQLVKLYEGEAYIIPDDYRLKLMHHIVGFKMQITKIKGIFKLGQNRSQQDQEGMLDGLRNQNTASLALAEFINIWRNADNKGDVS